MSEIYEEKTDQVENTEWDQLSQAEDGDATAPEQYTCEELAQLKKYEDNRAECQQWLEEKEEEYKRFERSSNRYDEAKKYYMVESIRLLVESYDDSIARIKKHEPAELPDPKEEEYIPEEAREILSRIPDTKNFKVLKKHVKSAYYSINVQFPKAMEDYDTIRSRREKYLKESGRFSNQDEDDFWFMKGRELNVDHEYNERRAQAFLDSAKEYVDMTEEPEALAYDLYADDERWDLRYYH